MTTKPKKPKARRMWMLPGSEDAFVDRDFLVDSDKAIPVAVLDVSDEAALIEVVAVAIYESFWTPHKWINANQTNRTQNLDDARAALIALGVLPKRRGK